MIFFSFLFLLTGHPVISADSFSTQSTPVTTLSLQQLLRPLYLPQIQQRKSSLRGGNDTGKLFRKLNLFSKLKWKSKEPAHDLATADSSPILRYSPYAMPPPLAMRPYPALPLTSASMRAMSYYPNPYFMSSDPYGIAARRVAIAQRPAYMPSPMPAYYPLGSLSGTPILDPSFQAALASSLVNRYSPPLPFIGGPFMPSSLYDEGIDQASLANILKRYFNKSNKKPKYPKYSDDLPPKSEYDYGFSPRYDVVPKIKYPPSRPSRNRDDRLKGYDYSGDQALDDMRSETPYTLDDGKFDTRAGIESPLTPPSLPRYRDRSSSTKETTSEPYVDIYGWRGPGRSTAEAGFEDMRGRNDSYSRYSSDTSHPYSSRSTSLTSASSSYDKEKERNGGDGEKERSF